MNIAIGFGSTEQAFESEEEIALVDFVTKAYRDQELTYFTDEFCREVQNWMKERAASYRELADYYKSASDYPSRYSYYWAHIVSDASYIIAIMKFHHINRRHGLSPDGWGLMMSERLFKVESTALLA